MLCEVGVVEVYVWILFLLVIWLCFYGIDFVSWVELIVIGFGVEEVCVLIGVDSFGYISEDGMVVVMG